MTYEDVASKIKHCENEIDLFEARAMLNKYKLLNNDAKNISKLQLMLESMSRKLAKADTRTILHY